MARHEQDLGLRTEAVIAIGVSKFSPNHKGNAVAFEEVLSEAKADNEPMIREAAAARNPSPATSSTACGDRCAFYFHFSS